MADHTAIEWTDATWNPVTGCTRVSPGCANCYIERTPPFRMAGRRFETVDGASSTGVRLHEDRLDQPLRWRKPRRVFVCSLADLFHDDVPFEYVDRVFGVIEQSPQHTFQVLTKRPERMRDYFLSRTRLPTDNSALKSCDPVLYLDVPQLWLGVSIENARYTWRADVLREIPAAVRFISAEPLLGSLYVRAASQTDASGTGDRGKTREVWDGAAVDSGGADLSDERDRSRGAAGRAPLDLTGIDWIIIGGESGPGSRPFHLEHAREIIDATAAHYLQHGDAPAIFVKQLGAKPTVQTVSVPRLGLTGFGTLVLRDRKGGDMAEWPADLRIREFPHEVARG